MHHVVSSWLFVFIAFHFLALWSLEYDGLIFVAEGDIAGVEKKWGQNKNSTPF